MTKIWMVSDEVRSEMAVAAVDAGIHAGLALGAVNALAVQTPSKELTKIGGYLSHISSTTLDAISTQLVDGLRCESYMTHDRNSCIHNGTHNINDWF